MRDHDGETTLKLRERLAIKVFVTTSDYDRAIATFLNEEQETETSFSLSLPLVSRLRYGENPHQTAALYGTFAEHFEKLHGKELSFNNILDITAASELIEEFSEPTVAILKHTNPCGVGSDPDLREAWEKAFATDKQAPFGGIIICNRPLDLPLAKAISEIFSEVIIAPDFATDARALLQKKKNLRLMRALAPVTRPNEKPKIDVRSVRGGVLVQQKDAAELDESRNQSRDQAPADEAGDGRDALRLAGGEAREIERHRLRRRGSHPRHRRRADVARRRLAHRRLESGRSRPLAQGQRRGSDAFFPFPDGLIAAAEAGATAAIQPGGSVRDAEVIAAADERKMAMIFTGVRHFRH